MKSKNISLQPGIEIKIGGPPGSFDWHSLIPGIIAGAIIIIGWLVVERFARRRELRADLRSAVDSVTSAVHEVRDAAVIFYRLPGDDPQAASLAATIRTKLGTLWDALELLREAGLSFDAEGALKAYRQSVTGGDFDSQARRALAAEAATFVRLSGDAETLCRLVQLAMLRHLLKQRESDRAGGVGSAVRRLRLIDDHQGRAALQARGRGIWAVISWLLPEDDRRG